MKYDFTTILNRYNTGSTKWEEMKEFGIDDPSIVPMSNAEMEFANAPEITEGLRDFLKTAVLSYYNPTPSFFSAISGWFERKYGVSVPQEHILACHNIHITSSIAVETFTEPGDGVLMLMPTWPGFFKAINRQGRHIVPSELVNTDGYYTIDYEDFEKKAADPHNRMMFLCSPHNPVGRVWKREELKRLADICLKHEVIVVSDEIHCDLVRPGYQHIPMIDISPESAQNTVLFFGCSKVFNLAGLDTSAVVIPNEKLREQFKKVRDDRGMVRPNMLGVKAMELALNQGEKWLAEVNSVIDANAAFVEQFVAEQMPKIRCTHLEGTYLMWLDLRKLEGDREKMELSLMNDARLFIDDGHYFGEGGPGFERVNIAVPFQVLEDAMHRLKAWYDVWTGEKGL